MVAASSILAELELPLAQTNVIIDGFRAGGNVMWALLLAAIVALAVVLERGVWWWLESRRRNMQARRQVLIAVDSGDTHGAIQLASNARDPVLRMLHHGLTHAEVSLQGAMQFQAGEELERAGRYLSVLDTSITLAPLLGLLGTVTGIMESFHNVGYDNTFTPQAVSAGIGQALIATACGLGIAIFCLLPFNYFQRRLSRLRFDLETNATNLELMVARANGRPVP